LSCSGIERAESLYGSIPEQLKDRRSFVSQLRQMLRARKEYRLAEGELVAVPEVKNNSCCILLLRVPGPYLGAITALNFSGQDIRENVVLDPLREREERNPSAGSVIDVLTGKSLGSQQGGVSIDVPAYSYKSLVIERAGR
jgi:hypothetical protein